MIDRVFVQTTEITVAEGGEMAFADLLMPGRIARGEMWSWQRLRLELAVRVDGELILRERLDQSGEELRALAKLAGIGRKSEEGRVTGESGVAGADDGTDDACCFGNVVIVSRALEESGGWREKIEALHGPGAWVGVSTLRGNRGGWSLKIVAADGAELRRVLGEVRVILAEKLPRMRASLRRV
ncbi:MAG: urease accessory protein UreD [Nibricoccus sp.]